MTQAAEVRTNALTTQILPQHHFTNHAKLPVTSAAYSPKHGLLVCDGRSLRLYKGTQCVRSAALHPTAHGALVRSLYYNAREDHFVSVYGSHEARIVDVDLTMPDAGMVNTEQLSILSSAWLHARQELVTAGGDGTLRFFALRKHFTLVHTGRRLLSRLVPRMTVCSKWNWMRLLYAHEADDRLMAASETDVLVWCMATGALLQPSPGELTPCLKCDAQLATPAAFAPPGPTLNKQE